MVKEDGIGLERTSSDEYILSMGPQHPSTHGVLRLLLRLDGEVIKDVTPDAGYIHSSMEKLCENRKYDQIMPYTDRLDYLSAVTFNMSYALAVEKLMGIQVPEKGQWLRVLLLEMNRIMSHLLWFSAFGIDMGALTPIWYAFRDREDMISMMEAQTGGRLTHHALRIGGVKSDLPRGFDASMKKFMSKFNDMLSEHEALLINNVIFTARTKGIGILDKKAAVDYAVSGPNMRATGFALDLRKAAPYSSYEKFNFEVCTGKTGDSWDRCKVRMDEMRESARIINQCMAGMPAGDIMAKVPRIIKPAPGEVYAKTEGPRGEVGALVVSDGTEKPYRVKFRSPSFSTVSALREMCVGTKIADLIAIMGSIDFIVPEIDR
jgi:NADH-quinone oxidoreductase subunit D